MSATAGHTRAGERSTLIGAIVVFSVGTLSGWLGPQIMAGTMQGYGFSAVQAGTLTLAEGLVVGLLSMALGAFAPQISHRRLAIFGFALFAAVNVASASVLGFWSLLALRLVDGISGAVLVFVSVSLVAMRVSNPDHGYAMLNVAGGIYGALIFALMPFFASSAQGLAFLPYVAIAAVLLAPLVMFIPADTKPARADAAGGTATTGAAGSIGPSSVGLFVLLFVIAVLLTSQAFMLFAFSPALSVRLGMSEAAANTTLSMATLGTIVGPFAVAPLVRRFGRWGPFFVGAVLFFGINFAVAHTTSASLFRIGLPASMMVAYFFLPLQLAWAAELDPSGRYSNILFGGVVITTSATPPIAGAFVDSAGLAVLSPIVMATGAAFICLLVVLRVLIHKPRSNRT